MDQRQALRDISTNSPRVKRQKTSAVRAAHGDAVVGYTLPEWQRKWRAIMTTCVVYFDINDKESKRNDRERAMKLFQGVGSRIQQFFDNSVTTVISRRPKSELPRNMVSQPGLKIWDYDKTFRFFRNLGEPIPDVPKDHQLLTMLNDEKLHGMSADRDPNAKRDDFIYFKGPFFYVFDIRGIVRPVAVREWKSKDIKHDQKKPWPHFHESSYGHSLFQADPSDMMEPRKVLKRKMRDEQNAEYRERLKLVYAKTNKRKYNHEGVELTESEDDTTLSIDTTQDESAVMKTNSTPKMPPPSNQQHSQTQPQSQCQTQQLEFQRPSALMRQHSLIQNKYVEPVQRDGFEIQASGYAGSVSQQSASASASASAESQSNRNGLAPSGSTVSSKQLSTLQKKIVEKKKQSSQLQHQQQQQSCTQKPKVSGYCENCKNHFDDFDEHVISQKHREFARDAENFEDIDNLIMALRERVLNKE
ncbi:protein serine/threonine kinase activating protein DBF4 CYBJADRAFT_166818 [Cyberlindnera jadinii NRRL Y-1542]|uniref:DBF4-type domain-containing protein n=1 Tax=Cyberlindnera jadinii (strain ATCC 18201 / CBS 1600 / BCRC 20928 / JCM 3617 / NBRC 0987 / NRRL Y-1542) TaxID=983966 RepID=A0A1E4S6C0_CYBJN|nr:hypothetical protein CYBJADRAFT_166818 [Cyberlindnera jadinii NRRL Y-1542]ODV75061.1 hypothetical protein CYBJADRAFT_166818 [Cyberlindnera jadinii NRRL Y-1542]